MKFVILSKYKIDAVENKLTEFISEDLIASIEEESTKILCAVESRQLSRIVKEVKRDNPSLRFVYEINIERKE